MLEKWKVERLKHGHVGKTSCWPLTPQSFFKSIICWRKGCILDFHPAPLKPHTFWNPSFLKENPSFRPLPWSHRTPNALKNPSALKGKLPFRPSSWHKSTFRNVSDVTFSTSQEVQHFNLFNLFNISISVYVSKFQLSTSQLLKFFNIEHFWMLYYIRRLSWTIEMLKKLTKLTSWSNYILEMLENETC